MANIRLDYYFALLALDDAIIWRGICLCLTASFSNNRSDDDSNLLLLLTVLLLLLLSLLAKKPWNFVPVTSSIRAEACLHINWLDLNVAAASGQVALLRRKLRQILHLPKSYILRSRRRSNRL